MGHIARPLSDRFWEKVKMGKRKACWLWQAGTNKAGYGRLQFGRRAGVKLAHRIAWFLTHGAWPLPGFYVLHTCDMPGCCNPCHLWLGTKADNARDMVKKGRMRGGHLGGVPKLSIESVKRIRREYRSREDLNRFAKKFRVSPVTIEKVVVGRTWKNVG